MANDVATINRVHCSESRRLEAVSAGDGIRPAKNLRQKLVRSFHLSRVLVDYGVRRYELNGLRYEGVRESCSRITLFSFTDCPRFRKTFHLRHPCLRERLDSVFAVIECQTATCGIDRAMQRQAIGTIKQIENTA